MASSIVGASALEQELFDHVSEHVEVEQGILDEYRQLAEGASSPAFRYLAELMFDDEVRHHRLFVELAEAIRNFAELGDTGWPIPLLGPLGSGGGPILEETQRFLALEREDARFLKDLATRLRPMRDMTLWHLIVQMMQCDTDKHIRMLRFIEHQTRRSL
jgi:rubrerythrin